MYRSCKSSTSKRQLLGSDSEPEPDNEDEDEDAAEDELLPLPLPDALEDLLPDPLLLLELLFGSSPLRIGTQCSEKLNYMVDEIVSRPRTQPKKRAPRINGTYSLALCQRSLYR